MNNEINKVAKDTMVIAALIILVLCLLFGVAVGIVKNYPCISPVSMECRTHEMQVCVDSGVYNKEQCVTIVEEKFAKFSK